MTQRSSCVPADEATLERLRDALYAHRIGNQELEEILANPAKIRKTACSIRDMTHSIDRAKQEIFRLIADGVTTEEGVKEGLAAQNFPGSTVEKAFGKLKLTGGIREHDGQLLARP